MGDILEVEGKWYPVVFAAIPNDFIRDKQVGPYHIALWSVLAMYMNKEFKCWPSLTTIAEKSGMNERTVRRMIEDLEKLGWISVQRRRGNHGHYRSHLFTLHPDLKETQDSQSSRRVDCESERPVDSQPTEQDILCNKNQVSKKIQKPPAVLSSDFRKWRRCIEILQTVARFKTPEVDDDFMTPDSIDMSLKCTKTLKTVIGHLESIERGRFERSIDSVENVVGKHDVADIEKLLDGATKRFIHARDDNSVFPVNKRALKALVNIVGFFKSYTGKSWLIWTMKHTDTICDKKEVSELDNKLNIPLDAHRVFREMFGWTSEVMQGLYGVQTRIEDIVQNPDYDMSSPQTETLWKEYIEMCQGWKGTGVAHLKSPKVWNIFEDRVEKTYGVDLHPVPVQEEAPRQAVERTTAEQIEWLRQHDHSPTAYIQIEELEEKLKGERND